jgi:hypothetical protein
VPDLSNSTDAADGQTKQTYGIIGIRAAIGGYTTLFVNNSSATPSTIQQWNGTIQEICDYNRALSDAEKNQVMGYLLGKWRIT